MNTGVIKLAPYARPAVRGLIVDAGSQSSSSDLTIDNAIIHTKRCVKRYSWVCRRERKSVARNLSSPSPR